MIKLPGKRGTSAMKRQSARSDRGPSDSFALLQEGERRIAAVEAQARARTSLQSLVSTVEQDIDADPMGVDPKALGILYTKTVRQVRDEQVKSIPDVAEQDVFVRRFGDHAVRRLGPLTEKLNSVKKIQAIARVDSILTSIADALSREDDGEEMDRLVHDGLGTIDAFAEALPVDDRTALKKGFHRKLAEAELTRLLDEDPSEAQEALKRGAFADMDQNLQDQWKRRAHHAEAARVRDTPRTEAAAGRVEAEARAKNQFMVFSELSHRIEQGELGFTEIDTAYANGEGALPEGLKKRLMAQLESHIEKDKRVTEATIRVGDIIAGSGSFSDRHDVDLGLVFDGIIGKCHPDMTADQGRLVLSFAEQVRRIPGPCLDPLWRCFGKGPLEKAGTCGGFLHRIGTIDELDLPIPDNIRPAFADFTSLIGAGWAPKDAIEIVRRENTGWQKFSQNAAPDNDFAGNAVNNEEELPRDKNEISFAFELKHQRAKSELAPKRLPRGDLAKREDESWDDWSVRIIEDLSGSSNSPEEKKEAIRRFYGELNKPENADVLAAAVQGVSQEAYLNPQSEPVSGPDLEDLEQWLSDNPDKVPSEAPLIHGFSTYLAKDGEFYRTSQETSKHIGRHARLLLGEI